MDLTKHLCVVFIGEPAVDDGGPLREFLYRLMVASDMLFCSVFNSRVPRHNLVVRKNTSIFVPSLHSPWSMAALGLSSFSPAVADYLVYGVQNVNA